MRATSANSGVTVTIRPPRRETLKGIAPYAVVSTTTSRSRRARRVPRAREGGGGHPPRRGRQRGEDRRARGRDELGPDARVHDWKATEELGGAGARHRDLAVRAVDEPATERQRGDVHRRDPC